MIKTVAYFPLQAARNSVPVLSAMVQSAQKAGITVVADSRDCDAVIMWSVLWAGKMAANQSVYQHYKSQNRPVIVVDVGALHRGITWKVAVDNITADGFYGHTMDLDWDRPKRLGINLGHGPHQDPHILIAAQHRRSLQVEGMPSVEQWVMDQVTMLRSLCDRPIKIRPHPRCDLKLSALPAGVAVETPRPVRGTYDSFDMQMDCHAVVNHNSGPGIQAAIHGIRPIVHESSLAHPVSISAEHIDQPYQTDRHTWLVQVCHTEYTLEELDQGRWLKRIESRLT